MIFDTHTHLNAEQFSDGIPETIAHAQELGVTEMAVVGFGEPMIERSLLLSQEYTNIYSIIGWHPTGTGSYTPEAGRRLQEQLTLPKIVALGEIGLDYYWVEDPKEVQEKVLRRRVAIARKINLPFSVHTREALRDTYRILEDEKISDIDGVMHSFSSDAKWVGKFLDLGLYTPFNGVVTLKKALDAQEVAMAVLLERTLVETDTPYLAPVLYHDKRNGPGYTQYVMGKIAELRQLTFEEMTEQTRANVRRLFRMDK